MGFSQEKPYSLLIIKQNFQWEFNEKRQEFIQTITDYQTSSDGKTYQSHPEQIGKKQVLKAQMLLVNGKPNFLELVDAQGERMGYFKQDEQEVWDALNEQQMKTK